MSLSMSSSDHFPSKRERTEVPLTQDPKTGDSCCPPAQTSPCGFLSAQGQETGVGGSLILLFLGTLLLHSHTVTFALEDNRSHQSLDLG